MRSSTRLSRPTTRDRRRPRSEPSDRPLSFRGIWTRRPSARMAMATWRRLRRSNRANDGLLDVLGEPERFAQSTRRSVIVQPPGPHRCGNETRAWPATSGRSSRTQPPGAASGPDTTRPPVARRSRMAGIGRPTPRGSVRPALSRLDDQRGAGQGRQGKQDPEPLTLEERQVRLHGFRDSLSRVRRDRSAAGRSPEGDPWLCVPASRRVCPGRRPRWRTCVLVGQVVRTPGDRPWEGSTGCTGHRSELHGGTTSRAPLRGRPRIRSEAESATARPGSLRVVQWELRTVAGSRSRRPWGRRSRRRPRRRLRRRRLAGASLRR